MGALVIQADKLPGGIAYLTDEMLDSLRPKAERMGHDHIVVRMSGKNVPFRYRRREVMELVVSAESGAYFSGDESSVGAGPEKRQG